MNDNTPHRSILRFRCSKCKRTEFVDAKQDPADGGYIIDAGWAPVQGWLRLYSTCVGMRANVQDMFCNTCKIEVLAMLGYPTVNSFEIVVKDNEALDSRRLNVDSSRVNVCDADDDTEEFPFYLLEGEEEYN
jgi:23S rRNA U2552 (ribose-2'-O)-methylase RlmE/FtsJ